MRRSLLYQFSNAAEATLELMSLDGDAVLLFRQFYGHLAYIAVDKARNDRTLDGRALFAMKVNHKSVNLKGLSGRSFLESP